VKRFFLTIFFLLILLNPVWAANTKVSLATGNWSTAGTWEVADSTFELDAVDSATQTIATAASWTSGATLTPGIITATSIGVKVSSKQTVGTFSVRLYNVTAGAAVAGTTVTVNVTDLPSYGWVKLTFAAPTVLLAATNYRVEAQVSNANQVILYRDGTAGNFYRFVTTSTTGAPGAGDRFYILGNWTAAATVGAVTVTFDETSGTPTDYGSASTTVASVNVGSKGTFATGNTASTNYWMKLSGLFHTTGDGTTLLGTTQARSSTTPTFKLQMDNAVANDFGIEAKSATNSILTIQGATMTPYTTIDANVAPTNTVITVGSTTGWLAGDRVVISPGRRTITEYEDRVISTVDSATQITLTAGVTYPHYGTAPYKGHIMNLTRNVQIYGTSRALPSYIDLEGLATVDIDYLESWFMGTSGNRGLTMQSSTGSSNLQYSSLHETNDIFVITNSSAATNNNVTVSNNVFFDCTTQGINMAVVPVGASNNNFTYDNNFAIKAPLSFAEARGSVSGNISTGATTGMVFGDTDVTAANAGINTGNIVYANTTGVSIAQCAGTISNLDAHFNASIGLVVNGTKEITIDTPVIYGNGTVNIDINGQNNLIFLSPTVSGFNDGTNNFSVATGMRFGAVVNLSQIVIKNGVFSNVTGVYTAHTSQDINAVTRPYMMQLVLENTYLGAANEFVQTAALSQNAFIASSKHDQTAGNYKTWAREGILTLDTTANMYDVTPSLRMTPSIATYPLKSYVGGSEGLYSIGKFTVAVGSTQAVDVSVKVRESVAGDGTDYNGQRAKLYVENNTIAGITSDTVLATATAASEGAFETLSGTTPVTSGDSVLSFYVAVGSTNYTQGWVNVDTFTATVTDSKGFKYFKDGMPYVVGDNSTGGGSSTDLLGVIQ
jgi:hypothetical protein